MKDELNKDGFDLTHPVQRGVIIDMDKTQDILHYIFEKQMNLDTKCINVLMTDSPFNTKKNKMEIADRMFDFFKVKSFALMNTAVLSLFSTGKTCGLVAECGEGISYTVPVFEGYALPHAMHFIPVAGKDVTDKLQKELGLKPRHSQYVRDMKEQMCHVALDFDDEYRNNDDPLSYEQRQYELPD
jgi:actin